MPFIEDKQEQELNRRLIETPEFEALDPTAKEVALATYRTENTVGSFFSQVKDLPDMFVDNIDYNPWDKLSDQEKLDESFLENAMLAD